MTQQLSKGDQVSVELMLFIQQHMAAQNGLTVDVLDSVMKENEKLREDVRRLRTIAEAADDLVIAHQRLRWLLGHDPEVAYE